MAELSRRAFVERVGAGALVAGIPWLRGAPAFGLSPGDGELFELSAAAMARLIRSREVSSAEIVRACLERIDAVNPALNAVVQLDAVRTLDRARAADRALARGERVGPLHGVPVTIKDSHDTQDLVTTAGTAGRAETTPERDATAVARLRAAGAIVMGKTNTPELTLSFDTVNDVYGRTRNPYDPSRSPGGSSGGAAAIIAAAGSPLDLGTDTGGSIRLPAHFCGIAGIKPTTGRVPRTGHAISFEGLHQSLTQVGPMARRVEDLALTLPIIAGPDGVDPHIVDMPLRDPAAVNVARLRVAFHVDNGIVTPIPAIRATVEAAATALEATGAIVEEAVPPGLKAFDDASDALWLPDGGAWVRRILQASGTEEISEELLPNTEAEPVSAAELTRLLEVRDRFRSRALGFWDDHDVLVCPTNAHVAMVPGEWREQIAAYSYTFLYNELGWPGAVVRCGATQDGLPIGVQVLAAPWREDRCLAVAAWLERQLGGWRPPDESRLLGTADRT